MAWTTPRTWVAGETVTAALLNAHLRDNLREVGQDAGLAAGWTAYTPTWTNLTTGNATVTASYQRIGITVFYRGWFTWGTTTSAGGTFYPSLPVATTKTDLLMALLVDTGTRSYLGRVSNTLGVIVNTESGNNGRCNATSPFAWGSGDQVIWMGAYEASS